MKLSSISVNGAIGNDFVETKELRFGMIKSKIGFVKTIQWLQEPFFSMTVIVNETIYSAKICQTVEQQEVFKQVEIFVSEVQKSEKSKVLINSAL